MNTYIDKSRYLKQNQIFIIMLTLLHIIVLTTPLFSYNANHYSELQMKNQSNFVFLNCDYENMIDLRGC